MVNLDSYYSGVCVFTTLALSEFSQCPLNNVHDSDTPGYLLIPLRLTA